MTMYTRRRRLKRRSWRARARPRLELPFSARIVLIEGIYGAIVGGLAIGVGLLIGEFGVWAAILWMLSAESIMRLFYGLMILISGLILSIPIAQRRRVRSVIAIMVAISLWLLISRHYGFHPIYSLFGPLPY